MRHLNPTFIPLQFFYLLISLLIFHLYDIKTPLRTLWISLRGLHKLNLTPWTHITEPKDTEPFMNPVENHKKRFEPLNLNLYGAYSEYFTSSSIYLSTDNL